VRLRADLVDGPLDRGPPLGLAQRAGVDGEDDVRGVARLGGKALVQHVQRRLRLRAGGPEVIDERAAGRAGGDAEGDQHHGHDRE
jgi:hypothetical protein